MIKALIVRRLVAVGFTLITTVAVPYIVQDKPVLKWGVSQFGPVFVDMAKDRIDSRK